VPTSRESAPFAKAEHGWKGTAGVAAVPRRLPVLWPKAVVLAWVIVLLVGAAVVLRQRDA